MSSRMEPKACGKKRRQGAGKISRFMSIGIIVFFAISFLSLLAVQKAVAQETVVNGRVTDAETGDPLPFVNVLFQGTYIGTTSDFDGYFSLSTVENVDSLEVSYIGYHKRVKAVTKGEVQTINFQLATDVVSLSEVVIVAGENPAYPIIRSAVKNKKKNDKKSLEAYEFESYNKLEVDVNQIPDRLRKKKAMQQVSMVLDSIQLIAGDDGKPVLPIFISESISKFYFRQNPQAQREHILNTKLTGVGIQDGSLVSQFIGSSFQEYNFYENWMTIVEKEFVSPIADGWKIYYDYELMDSMYIGTHFCYRLDVYPNSPQDLAFQGSIWITKNEYALKQLDLTIQPSANLNFIKKIRIQQELEPTAAGPWVPTKARKLFDIAELNNAPGILLKSYTSNKDYTINSPHPVSFYQIPIEVAEDAKTPDETFWDEKRHEPLSQTEKNVYIMIDTLQKIPVVKSYIDIMNILVNGYKKVGKVDIGPYLLAYANNNIEGSRFRLGFRTNIDFSRKWVFKGFLAYGTKDEMFKYNAAVQYILSRKPWTVIGASYGKDVEQVGLTAEEFQEISVFYAISNFGTLVRPYINTEAKVWFQSEISRGLTNSITFKNKQFSPLYDFTYRETNAQQQDILQNRFQVSEVTIGLRYAKNELFVQNDNERVSLGNGTRPRISMYYTYGFKDLLGGDFEYHKVALELKQNLKMGVLGRSAYTFTSGKIFSTLPYPLLKVHVGNETFFSATNAYNLMNELEFVSDRYFSLNYQHYFEGFILNRIPLMKKLKWRLVATGNILFGDVTEANRAITPHIEKDEESVPAFESLSFDKPYIEVGYGIENILKFIRVDAYHRLTYLDKPDISKFGVKINFQFIL